MKKLFFFGLLVPLIFFTACKNGKGIFEKKCTTTCRCTHGWVRFTVLDKDGKDYFLVNETIITAKDFAVYDENWNYATSKEKSWELLKNRDYIINESYIDFISSKDPYGMDRKKTFYIQFKEDIDTLQLEFRSRNECMYMDYIRIFYNQKLILEDTEDIGYPLYSFGITK